MKNVEITVFEPAGPNPVVYRKKAKADNYPEEVAVYLIQPSFYGETG